MNVNRKTPVYFLGILAILTALFVVVVEAYKVRASADSANADLDKIFADVSRPGSPGCALGIFRNGQIIYEKGYGLASVELNAPITPESVFDIGSTSKQFTATSILLLEQKGKLSLNDDVRKYIPELPDYSKSTGRAITILNLLNHTSGLRDYLTLLSLAGVSSDSVTTDDDALALIIRQRGLNFPSGSKWSYSNTGFFLLSIIVKRVSGTTLKEFASHNIFQPLGMSHTTFRDDHTMLVPHRALAYDPGEKDSFKLNVSYYEQLGDGAVHTSVQDLAKWDENFYTGQVGGKSFLEEIQERGRMNGGKALDYAKGLFIGTYRGLRTVRHGGAWGGYRAELLRFPDQHFSVACLCNLSNANPEKRAEQVAGVYLQNIMQPEKSGPPAPQKALELTPAQRAAVSGTYRSRAEPTIARVSSRDGKLQLEIYGRIVTLRALSPTEFVPLDFPVDISLTFDPQKNTMKISGDEMLAADYDKVHDFAPSAEELAPYAGDYSSDELAVVYRIRVVDGKLRLVQITDIEGIPRTGIGPSDPLRPITADEFEIANQGLVLDFQNNDGNVAGFTLGAGGTRGIVFSRMLEVSAAHPTPLCLILREGFPLSSHFERYWDLSPVDARNRQPSVPSRP